MINVTPTAAEKISELLTEENKTDAGLRVFVQGGGCSGFQYGLMIDEGEGDATTDAVIESNGVKLLVDPISVRYLQWRRSRLRRQRDGRRVHHQEPEREVDLRLRFVLQRVEERSRVCRRWILPADLRRQPSARRQQALQQARPHRQRLPAPGGTSHGRRPGRPDSTEDQRISRATIYRTLQWMVDAGIARKVDFGEGRFRFEHSYRHPRHFHLICKTCNQSFEFLSSDIESLIEEVATARNFARAAERAADLRHLRGLPHRAAAVAKAASPSCCSRATRCGLRSPPNAAASTSTPARRA